MNDPFKIGSLKLVTSGILAGAFFLRKAFSLYNEIAFISSARRLFSHPGAFHV